MVVGVSPHHFREPPRSQKRSLNQTQGQTETLIKMKMRRTRGWFLTIDFPNQGHPNLDLHKMLAKVPK